jgi:hypothetical protein
MRAALGISFPSWLKVLTLALFMAENSIRPYNQIQRPGFSSVMLLQLTEASR